MAKREHDQPTITFAPQPLVPGETEDDQRREAEEHLL